MTVNGKTGLEDGESGGQEMNSSPWRWLGRAMAEGKERM